MKFRITFKDPDGVYDSLDDAGINMNEMPEDVEYMINKFLWCREYVTIEFDTDEETARVVPDAE